MFLSPAGCRRVRVETTEIATVGHLPKFSRFYSTKRKANLDGDFGGNGSEISEILLNQT